MGTPVFRYDFAPITGSETTDEGYLRVWCRAARSGTQLYRKPDGSQIREYRPPEEVSKPESLSTFGMKPVTWTHPPKLLDSTNASEYQKGFSGSQVRYSDGFVEVALMVTDNDTIKRIKQNQAKEVSAGYKVDFDPTPGITKDGEEYSGIQRNIRVNHIAIVPRGRAGPEVRLLLDRIDAADAVAEVDQDPSPPREVLQPRTTESPGMASVNLDGLEIDLPPEAATAVQSYTRELGRQMEAISTERDEFGDRLDAMQVELENLAEENETVEERADSLEEQIEDGAVDLDTEQLDELVALRLDTLQTLAPAFEPDFQFDGIDDDDLYRIAFMNLTGQELDDDADPDYVQGVVEGLLARGDDEEDDDDYDPEYDDDEEEDDDGYYEPEYDDDELVYEDRADSTDDLRYALRGAGRSSANPVTAYREKLETDWMSSLTATKPVK